MEGLGTDVRTMGLDITKTMTNQRIDTQKYEQMNLLVMLPKGSSHADLIRTHMMSRWERKSNADFGNLSVQAMVTSYPSRNGPAIEHFVDVYDGKENVYVVDEAPDNKKTQLVLTKTLRALK